MKVAIVHYWLVSMRGGEKVLEALCELFPDADLFTHVYKPSVIPDTIKRHRIHTTFIQKLPGAIRHYKSYFPLMPLALEQVDLSGYDLVISSESGPSKGVVTSPGTLHVCYCHTPMRYVWDMYHTYRKEASWITRIFMTPIMHYLRIWDLASAPRVDHFIANSSYTAMRIKKHYRRESEIVHPPVETEEFYISKERGDFYLFLGELVPYKRADIAVEAFNRLKKRLVIIGDGEQMAKIKKMAGSTITLMGRQSFSVICDHYSRCKALIFPGIEDFGIVPVEAMASGRPVIAFRGGGVLDTIIEGVTGLFFDKQTPESLINAVLRFENLESKFSSESIVKHASQFDKKVFNERIQKTIIKWLKEKY